MTQFKINIPWLTQMTRKHRTSVKQDVKSQFMKVLFVEEPSATILATLALVQTEQGYYNSWKNMASFPSEYAW